MTAKTPTSAPGSKRPGLLRRQPGLPRRVGRRAWAAPSPALPRGFTLIELMLVLMLIALVSGLAGLALRDGSEARLEREALRLGALLEAGRAEARSSGVAVRFELLGADNRQPGNTVSDAEAQADFRFVGVSPALLPPGRWLDAELRARIDGARALLLGPEPLIGAQRITLGLGDRQLVLATDGLAPFSVLEPAQGATP